MACTEKSNYYFAHARCTTRTGKGRHEVRSESTLTSAVSVMRVLAFKRVLKSTKTIECAQFTNFMILGDFNIDMSSHSHPLSTNLSSIMSNVYI